MNTVPTHTPSTIATTETRKFAPIATPTIPVARVVRFAFDMNHSENRLDGVPVRSVSGTQSMDFTSIPLVAGRATSVCATPGSGSPLL